MQAELQNFVSAVVTVMHPVNTYISRIPSSLPVLRRLV